MIGKNHIINILLLLFLLFFTIKSFAQTRIALVIGNSNYQQQELKNPINDAIDMSKTLRKLGFEVELKLNTSQEDMEDSIQKFGKKLEGDTVGLFYYSGHGVQYEGGNYLIPIGAMSRVSAPGHLRYKTVDVGYILGVMKQAGNGLNIVILDACRNSPFRSFFRSANKGLKRLSGVEGTIIAYSTSPGKIALDGNGRNSPYTKHLIKLMKYPNLPVEIMFKRVRRSVKAETFGKQSPWYEASIDGDFYFSTKNKIPLIENKNKFKKSNLTISTKPEGGSVRIIDFPYPYKDGVELPIGRHRIEVRKNGYKIEKKWIVLKEGSNDLEIKLKKKISKFTSNFSKPVLKISKRLKHIGDVRDISLSSNGEYGAGYFHDNYGSEKKERKIRVWKIKPFKEIFSITINTPDEKCQVCGVTLTLSADGELLLYSSTEGLHLINLKTSSKFLISKNKYYKAEFNPKNKNILFLRSASQVHIYNIEDKSIFKKFDASGSGDHRFDTSITNNSIFFGETFSKYITSCDLDNLECNNIDLSPMKSKFDDTNPISISPNEKFISLAKDYNTVNVFKYNVSNISMMLEKQFTLSHDNTVTTMGFINNQYLVTGSVDRSVAIWDVYGKRKVTSYQRKGKLSYVTDMDISLLSNHILVGSLYGVVYLFKTQ